MIPGRRLSIPLLSALVAALVVAPAAMAGTTYYAASNGSGSECSQGHRCRPEEAAKKAQNGDSVLLAPGTYELTGQVDVSHAVEFGGESSAEATVLKVKSGATLIDDNAGALVHDMSVVGTGSFLLNAGTAERLYVSVSGTASTACSLSAIAGSTPVLRDSVCWLHDSSIAGASAVHVGDYSGTGTARLFNDDAVSAATSGNGLRLEPTGPAQHLTVEVTNSIVLGLGEDILVTASGSSSATLTNSNFSTAFAQPGNTVTAPGSGTNQTAEPQLVKPTEGNFHERPGSVTIGAGLFSPEIGSLDLDRKARSQGGGSCQGAPDIGAYEFEEATPACPASESKSAPLNMDLGGKLKVAKVKLNKLKGTAVIPVKLPEAGQIALFGKGVKRVVRSSKTAAGLQLPVSLVGGRAKALRAKGKLAIEVRMGFKGIDGEFVQASRKFNLVKVTSKAKASH